MGDTSPDASSCSIHTAGETNAASSFAHRCATASRLQLFDSTNNANILMSSTGNNEGIVEQNAALANFSNQLADFRNFGASLLQSSSHPLEVNNSDSREMQNRSSTATPTP